MDNKRIICMIAAGIILSGSTLAAAQGRGNGKGNGGGEDPPAETLTPAYAYTLSGRAATINIANQDFSSSTELTVMSDARTRGLDHAPDEGRVLVEEFRALYETSYSVEADGTLSVTGRTLLFNGDQSAASLRCIATAPNGVHAYSLTSAVGGELVISSRNNPLYNVGTLESCDFNSNGATIVAIDNLPGPGGHELVSIDVATGARTSLLFGAEDQFSLDEVMVAPDGGSYLLSWTDRRGGTFVRKVSEWRPGELLTTNPVIATNALHASFACDLNENGATDDGYVYQSGDSWIEDTSTGRTELIASKGNKGVYWLRPAC